MATELQRTRLRADLDANSSSLTDGEIDDLYLRGAEVYTDSADTDLLEIYVRILAIRQLRMAAAKRVDYRQNESEEKLSQIQAALRQIELVYQGELDRLSEERLGHARWGNLRRKPTRIEEYPDA